MRLTYKVKDPKKRGLQLMALGGLLFFLPSSLPKVEFVARTSFFLTFAGIALFLGGIFLNGSSNGHPVTAKVKNGLWLMYWAALIAFSPIGLAAISTSPGHNLWSEGDSQSGGSAIWAMLVTVPIGLIVGIIGLVQLASGSANSQAPTQKNSEN